MKEIILCKLGEIALKGQNKAHFEKCLVNNIKEIIGSYCTVRRSQSIIYVQNNDEFIENDEVVKSLEKIFGIATISRAIICEKDMESIKALAKENLRDVLKDVKTFKVTAKRSDKKFPLQSPEIAREIGGTILSVCPYLKVDVRNPEVLVTVEIREEKAYLHTKVIKGACGMPVGCNGQAALLLSGGIDSPVAGYMMAKRGLKLTPIYFHAHPYTSDRAKEKVVTLAKILKSYAGKMNLYVVNFTKIQEEIKKTCEEEYFTIVMRRIMMKISEKIADENELHALITGESLGQVASQTIKALGATNDAVDLPVFRPLIGLDKQEIVEISQKIDTFETSILPYEDCCTVFTPKHPKIRPQLKFVLNEENKLNVDEMIKGALSDLEIIEI